MTRLILSRTSCAATSTSFSRRNWIITNDTPSEEVLALAVEERPAAQPGVDAVAGRTPDAMSEEQHDEDEDREAEPKPD